MSEILFRGKRLDNGEWVEGDLLRAKWYLNDVNHHFIFTDAEAFPANEFIGFAEVLPDTVGQYTGLKDMNGKRIFEGDLCLCDRHISDSFDKTVFEIMFDPLRGYYGESYLGSEFDGTSFELCEVIGNIHDNPELLRGGADGKIN